VSRARQQGGEQQGGQQAGHRNRSGAKWTARLYSESGSAGRRESAVGLNGGARVTT